LAAIARVSLSWYRERVQPKRIGVREIAVVETAQKPEARDAVEAKRGVRNADDINGFVETDSGMGIFGLRSLA
jgi:hypothetical protein